MKEARLADPDPVLRVRPLLFGLPRLATSYLNVSLVTLALPVVLIDLLRPDTKGLHLGLITASAALLSIAVLYLVGRYSDKHRARLGRGRYPLYGLGLSLLPLASLIWGGPYPSLVAAIVTVVVSRSITEGTHLPLLVEHDGFGATNRYTAAIAFYQILGAGAGALIFSYLGGGASTTLAPAAVGMAVVLAAMVGYQVSVGRLPTVRSGVDEVAGAAREEPSGDTAGSVFPLPKDLKHLLLARLFFLAGIFIVSTYLVFLVADVMRARDVSATAGGLFAIAVAGGLVSAFPARRLTERVGEIPALLCAGGVLAIAAAVFVLFGGRVPWMAWASMVCYGAGFATVVSAGLSLTVFLIPRPELAGRIMAVVIASTFASQFLASMIGAVILDPLNRWASNAGYYGLLVAAEVCFVLGAVFLVRLQALRRPVALHS